MYKHQKATIFGYFVKFRRNVEHDVAENFNALVWKECKHVHWRGTDCLLNKYALLYRLEWCQKKMDKSLSE